VFLFLWRSRMPLQKNSGNKGAKRETGVSSKNRTFIQTFIDDVRVGENVEDVYIAKVIKTNGNGRLQVFFIDDSQRPTLAQAVIRGSFRGRGKRSVWIDVKSIVLIASSGVGGSAEYSIMAVLTGDNVRDIRKFREIDARILTSDDISEDQLLQAVHPANTEERGFEFDIPETVDTVDIDNI
jgi:hypothetical protein